MPANIECPCGHTVRVPDELVKTRIKCPVCGELLSAKDSRPEAEPSSAVDSSPTDPSQDSDAVWETTKSAARESSDRKATASTQTQQPSKADSDSVSAFHAMGGFLFAGLPIASFFTKASVTLLPQRVGIKTAGLFCTRRLDLRLSEVTSAETRRSPDWFLFLLGILLLPANGAGLILLIVFLFTRHSFLILRCGTATVAIRFNGDDTDACAIGDAILQAAHSQASISG